MFLFHQTLQPLTERKLLLGLKSAVLRPQEHSKTPKTSKNMKGFFFWTARPSCLPCSLLLILTKTLDFQFSVKNYTQTKVIRPTPPDKLSSESFFHSQPQLPLAEKKKIPTLLSPCKQSYKTCTVTCTDASELVLICPCNQKSHFLWLPHTCTCSLCSAFSYSTSDSLPVSFTCTARQLRTVALWHKFEKRRQSLVHNAAISWDPQNNSCYSCYYSCYSCFANPWKYCPPPPLVDG